MGPVARLAVCLGLLAACGETPGPSLELAAGPVLREHLPARGSIPAEPVDIAWTAEPVDGHEVFLWLEDTTGAQEPALLTRAPLGSGVHRFPTPGQRHGFYRIVARVMTDDGTREVLAVTSPTIEVVQGLHFHDTGSLVLDEPRDLELTISTASTITITFRASSPQTGVPLGAISVASDLAPIGRSIRWRGVPLSDTFAITASVFPSEGPGYDVDGPQIVWTSTP